MSEDNANLAFAAEVVLSAEYSRTAFRDEMQLYRDLLAHPFPPVYGPQFSATYKDGTPLELCSFGVIITEGNFPDTRFNRDITRALWFILPVASEPLGFGRIAIEEVPEHDVATSPSSFRADTRFYAVKQGVGIGRAITSAQIALIGMLSNEYGSIHLSYGDIAMGMGVPFDPADLRDARWDTLDKSLREFTHVPVPIFRHQPSSDIIVQLDNTQDGLQTAHAFDHATVNTELLVASHLRQWLAA